MEQIAIRDVQHFLYCPHRWGLMRIDCAWAENYFVVKSNLMHERAHDAKRAYSLRGRKTFTGLSVYCDLPGYELNGKLDCLEGTLSPNGTRLGGATYDLCIVEYKPTQPKGRDFNDDDAMQVFAQKVCLDSMLHCDCDAAIYYADVKKRVPLPFRGHADEWGARLRDTLARMRAYLDENRIPPIAAGQQCGGCSMKDVCMPALKHRATVRERIATAMEDTSCESC